MSEHARTRDLLGPYVMGELDDAEKRLVGEHLGRCEACSDEAESLRAAHERLAELASGSEGPPPHLKERAIAGLPAQVRRRGLPLWAAAAAAVLLVTFGIAYGLPFLRGQEVAAAVLEPTGLAPEAGGEVEITGGPENMEVHLEAWGLPPCGREEYYELWLVEGEERISAGSFTVGRSGAVEVVLNAPGFADTYPQVGITAESDRDPRPGDAKVLGGELRRS